MRPIIDPAVIVVANRTVEHARTVARDVRGEALPLNCLTEALTAADVVFSATSAPGTVIAADVVRAAMAVRPDRPLMVLDLAVPRDVDAAAADVAGVTLRTLDTIRAAVDHTLSTRSAEVPQVEAIVAEEASASADWTRSLAATPTLVALREHFERIRIEELDRVLGHASDEERQRAERLTRVLVNRSAARADAAAEGDRRGVDRRPAAAAGCARPVRARRVVRRRPGTRCVKRPASAPCTAREPARACGRRST